MLFGYKTKQNLIIELTKFGVVGVLSTVVNYLSFTVFKGIFSPYIANGVGFIIGTCLSYFGAAYWIYPKKKSPSKLEGIIYFFGIYFCSLLINSLAFLTLLKFSHHEGFSWFIALVISIIWNFSIPRMTVFKNEEKN